jgi:hypothetical protein
MIQSPPRRIYRQTVALRLALGILFLLAAGVFIAAGLGSDPVEYLGVGIGVLILAAYAGLWVAMGKTTVAVFSEGVRRSSVFGVRELLWSDIAEYRYRIVPVNYGGLVGGVVGMAVQAAVAAKTGKAARSLKLTLVGESRRDIRVTSNFQNAEQAIGMSSRRSTTGSSRSSSAAWRMAARSPSARSASRFRGSPGRARSGFP